jgi:ketosteroid isomerase-like protein
MRTIIRLFLVASIISCNTGNKTSISDSDRKQLTQLHENYRSFWLENDSAKVVNLFAEDGAIIPPNNKGDFVRGKKAIGAWWFTKNGDTTYPITSFVYKNDTLTASGELATWEGVSEVGWNIVAGDSVLSSHSSASNFITVCKKEKGDWKIYRQIWNVKPLN